MQVWPLRLRGLIQSGEASTLEQLLRNQRFNSFAASDTAQSWSYVDFFVRTRRKGFRAYLAKLTSKKDPVAVFKEAFGESPEEVDAAWRKWALKRY